MTDEADDIAATAREAADAARAETLPRFRTRDLGADNKLEGGFDPVTEADRAAERAIRAVLARRRPDDAIVGEEYGPTPGRSGLTWVLDPVDGTRAFISGIPSWGTLIGVTGADGMPIHGLVDQPWTGERFEGGRGPARLTSPRGETPLGVRGTTALADATLMTTFPELGGPGEAEAFRRVSARARLTRYGLDCYAYALLAAGHVDLVIESGLQAYDIVAPMAVILAAGGIVTAWDGGPAQGGGRVIAAATPELHRAAMELLA
ncbi:histidinol-phosphatase [Paracoccus sp. S-4012]|uniref:inositol monophosphatase family protein n=1 Tax=Paracoccus sp. S-4012 TaxID=2665648 RepID=UPI0012AF147F|nr:inositol monophosphatase family protein [Paracoccus sp. S-4012]MRX51567.1 histidinol-phosphatase [Paracoccus sp. S-4012]